MKFLLDANIPYSAKQIFRATDEVFHVRDIGLGDASDRTIIAWAKKRRAVLVTRDFDFANILNFPPQEYFGIVVLKVPPSYHADSIKRVLAGFLSRVDAKSLPGATVIVEEGRFRVRRK